MVIVGVVHIWKVVEASAPFIVADSWLMTVAHVNLGV